MGVTGVLFLLGFTAGCVLALLRHPIYGLMTYVAVFYMHPPSRWWGAALPHLRWALLAAAVTALAVLLHRRAKPAVPLFRHKLMAGMVLFILWIALQSLWALDPLTHRELLVLYAKYLLLLVLMYASLDTEKHLRWFLWTHVLGCFYLGWLVYGSYSGGRFEDFGGPGIDEANAAAMQVVTGMLVGGSLFLAGPLRDKIVLTGLMPFVVNALVTTISRSGFLAAAVGGLIFNYFAPLRGRLLVRVASVLGIVLFFVLTNPLYWARMESLKHGGEVVEGIDTGAGRLAIIDAQWRMFLAHPLGCGHRCTAVLSPEYLEERHLTGEEESRARSSHNTFMTMLVEHGVPGALFYIAMAIWLARTLRALGREQARRHGFLAMLFPAVAGTLAAITIGDLFVDYLKLEVRFWFFGVLMVVACLAAQNARATQPGTATAPARPAVGDSGSRAGLP